MNIESYLPAGCVTNGTVDYTSQCQTAINANEILTGPDFPIMVNDRGLSIPSDREITFHAPLIQKSTASGSYNAIRIQRANNVILHNPIVSGERQQHIGTSGEWGHGIAIYGSSNVTINSPQVTQCWGDGIYIAGSEGVPSRNITINDAQSTYCRRNGIAIVSVIGLLLNSPTCSRTSGVLPMSGIDIEPASSLDEIQGVVIINPTTTKSQWYGISIGLSELFGGGDKHIDVTITNWTDSYSKAALRASVNLNRRIGVERVSGVIEINNPYWKDNSIAPWQVDIRTADILLKCSTPNVRKNLDDVEILALLTKKENLNGNKIITF